MSRLPLNTGSQHLDSTSQGSPRTDGGDDSPHQSQSAFENQKTLGFPSSSSRMLMLDNRKTSGSPAPTWPHAYNFSLPPKTHFLRLAIDRAFNARKINIKLIKSAPCLGKNNKPLAPSSPTMQSGSTWTPWNRNVCELSARADLHILFIASLAYNGFVQKIDIHKVRTHFHTNTSKAGPGQTVGPWPQRIHQSWTWCIGPQPSGQLAV